MRICARLGWSSALAVSMVFGVACIPFETAVTSTTQVVTTTSSTMMAASTTTTPPDVDRVGLFRMDPETMEPVSDVPLTTGDFLRGSLSPNGRWLVLNVWKDTKPETDMIRVLDLETGHVVTEIRGLLHDVSVADDGSVYYLASDARLKVFRPGSDRLETVMSGLASIWGHTVTKTGRWACGAPVTTGRSYCWHSSIR